jgi:hypothetical protein
MVAIEELVEFDNNGRINLPPRPDFRNKKARVIFLFDETEHDDFLQMSLAGLARAYGENEPEYDLSMISEPNPDYEKP